MQKNNRDNLKSAVSFLIIPIFLVVVLVLSCFCINNEKVPSTIKYLIAILDIILIILVGLFLFLSWKKPQLIERLNSKYPIEKSDVFYMILPSIIGAITLCLVLYRFMDILLMGDISKISNLGDIVNVLISISAIIFAVQGILISRHKKRSIRFFFSVVLFTEVLFLGFIGYSYFNDIGEFIKPPENECIVKNVPSFATLFLVFFSLCYTVVTTAFFIIINLFFPSKELEKNGMAETVTTEADGKTTETVAK